MCLLLARSVTTTNKQKKTHTHTQGGHADALTANAQNRAKLRGRALMRKPSMATGILIGQSLVSTLRHQADSRTCTKSWLDNSEIGSSQMAQRRSSWLFLIDRERRGSCATTMCKRLFAKKIVSVPLHEFLFVNNYFFCCFFCANCFSSLFFLGFLWVCD